MGFFYSKPRHATKIQNVGDAIGQLAAFNAQKEAGYKHGGSSIDNSCEYDDEFKASWRKAVYDGVINTGGEPTEIDFFERAMGTNGTRTTSVEASELFIKYRGSKDYNIVSNNSVDAAGPGQPATFTLLKSLHSYNGKYSNVAVGGQLYLHESNRTVVVTAVDTTTDYAHQITVVPRSKYYTVAIVKGKKMLFNPVRMVNGMSCSIPNSTWETPGYVQSVKPYRLRKDWETPLDLMRPFEEVMQFALTFDNEGNEIDSFEMYDTTSAREEFRYMRNIQFFLGEPTDNPLLVNQGVNLNQKYSGFMGYLPTLQYAGGTVYDIEASEGFDLDTDFQAVIIHQDAQKKSKEFMVIHGLQFWLSMHRRSQETFANATGACTFETFKRTGAKQEDIEKLGIQSYRFANRTLHFHEVEAFTDRRALGNGIFPHLGIMMPTTGIRTSKGRDVPPVEFFNPSGPYSSYEEIFRDHRHLENGCEKLSGTLTETIMMAVHAPENHILLNPILNA